MSFDQIYLKQVDLLLDVLPILNQFDCFALKGGTAINLFVRDMPRLSVDIDLTYLPIESRDIFLRNITSELTRMKDLISQKNLTVKESYSKDQQLMKLFVYGDDAVIKIEPNTIIRGAVFQCEQRDLCQRVQDQFLKYANVKVLSLADLYGGKICAALDRQHPRDLFDIKFMLADEGLTDEIRRAFVVYLASSNRPIHEMLNYNPNMYGFDDLYKKEFAGMADSEATSIDELKDIRHSLIREILANLTSDERKFLITLKSGEPDWSLMPVENIDKLPAIRWKLHNIKKIPKSKKDALLNALKDVLQS